jgi:hypothetical protein
MDYQSSKGEIEMSEKAMTKKQMVITRRTAIMSSHEFQEWYAARRGIRPIPSDPYRAYMIDLSLRARLLPKQYWRTRTPWSDYPPIDYPRGMPIPKPRTLSRKELKRLEKIPKLARPRERTAVEKEIERTAEEMYEKYHVPHVPIYFVPERGHAISYYHAGQIYAPSYIRLGTRGAEKGKAEKAQVLAALKHEIGHHVHFAFRGLPETLGITTPFPSAHISEREKIAWKIAKPHLTDYRQIQMWQKRWALGTYLGTSGKRIEG